MPNAIVTGASSGIGEATSLALARRGWSVALVARRVERLQALADRIGAFGGRAVAVPADVAERDQAATAARAAEDAHGPTDLLVNNAGIAGTGSLVRFDLDAIERVMRVNYFGAVHFTKAVLPGMLERGRGHIVNVASVAGRVGVPGAAPYVASKFALAGLSESLAAEVARHSVTVTLINPGFVETEGFPHLELLGTGLVIRPPAVARAIVEAVERRRAEASVPRAWGALQAVRVLAPPLYRRALRIMASRFPR